jgi:hypothetical protein
MGPARPDTNGRQLENQLLHDALLAHKDAHRMLDGMRVKFSEIEFSKFQLDPTDGATEPFTRDDYIYVGGRGSGVPDPVHHLDAVAQGKSPPGEVWVPHRIVDKTMSVRMQAGDEGIEVREGHRRERWLHSTLRDRTLGGQPRQGRRHAPVQIVVPEPIDADQDDGPILGGDGDGR